MQKYVYTEFWIIETNLYTNVERAIFYKTPKMETIQMPINWRMSKQMNTMECACVLVKNPGVGCHVLFQGILPTQRSNPLLLSLAFAGGFFTTSTTWEAHVMKYYLTIENNKVLIHATTRMNLENIMLNERSQLQSTTCCTIPYMWIHIYEIPRIDKCVETESRLVVVKGYFPGGAGVKNPSAIQETQETWVQSLGQEDPLE